MSADTLEIIRDGDAWTWANGERRVEARDPLIRRDGAVRAVVTVVTEGALLHRSSVTLTSDRERERFLGKVEAAGGTIPGGLLLALEETIRQNPPAMEERETGQGTRLALEDPEPWPEPVDGPDLLTDLVAIFLRFLGLPEAAPEALALWVMHAHAHDTAEVSPLLALTSPEKRCGKTTALHLLGALVPRPLPASNVTAAALFRAVEQWRPTLLVDEADTFLKDREELRGVLNSGHARASAVVVRTVGEDHEARTFSTWGPKAVAMIGELPDTLADRSVVVPMRRRHPDEQVEALRLDRLTELEPLRRMAARWTSDHGDALRTADPAVPKELHDRQADNWRPLLAIADRVGGEWPERARSAARGLAGLDDGDDGSVRTLLLRDLRDLFQERGTDRLPSSDVTDALERMEERPWPEWGRARKPMTPTALARLLKPFGVRPKVLKLPDGSTARGYLLEELEEPFRRYLPPEGGSEPSPPSPSSNGAENSGSGTRNPEKEVTGRESAETPHEYSDVTGVTPREGGSGGVEPDREPVPDLFGKGGP